MRNRMAMMKAPGVVELVEKEMGDPGNRQVLIAIKASGICGSDLHIYKGKHPYAPLPVAIGHEFAGEVVAVGKDVTQIKTGDRVTVEPTIVCERCLPCLQGEYGFCDNIAYHYRKGQGALAQYFIADERFVYKLPSHLSYEAAALIEPLAVAVHAVKRAKVGLGDSILILGAGAIGILVAAASRAAGAAEIVIADIIDFRLEKAISMGATRGINSHREGLEDAVARMTQQRGMGKIFECVGLEQTLRQAIQLLRKGGVATVLGIFEQTEATLPVHLFVAKEITVQGSQAYCWDYETAIDLTQQIDLKKMITHVMPLEEIDRAFKIAADPGANAIKLVMQP